MSQRPAVAHDAELVLKLEHFAHTANGTVIVECKVGSQISISRSESRVPSRVDTLKHAEERFGARLVLQRM